MRVDQAQLDDVRRRRDALSPEDTRLLLYRLTAADLQLMDQCLRSVERMTAWERGGTRFDRSGRKISDEEEGHR